MLDFVFGCGKIIPQRSFFDLKTKMSKNLQKFGEILKNLRIEKGLTLRDVYRLTNYDPSNWSKIERGKLNPPSNEKTLRQWAKVLGVAENKRRLREFIDRARIAQSIIPDDILSEAELVEALPAFFRTLRGEKASKEEIDKLIELIRKHR